MLCVLLDPGIDGRRRASCERSPAPTRSRQTPGRLALLDRLLVAGSPGDRARRGGAPARGRPRPAARGHPARRQFGDRIEADAPCQGCSHLFAIAFSLAALVEARDRNAGRRRRTRPRRALPPGRGTFRLPTSEDVDAVIGLPADNAARCCWPDASSTGENSHARPRSRRRWRRSGRPWTDLDVTCPHCAARAGRAIRDRSLSAQDVANDRRFLLHETHRSRAPTAGSPRRSWHCPGATGRSSSG